MNAIFTILSIIFVVNTYGQENYEYNLEEESNLLLVKQVNGETKLIFMDTDTLRNLSIYNFDIENNIELEKTFNIDDFFDNYDYWYRDMNLYKLDYVNETLYLAGEFWLKDSLNNLRGNRSLIIMNNTNDKYISNLDNYEMIEDVLMINENEGVIFSEYEELFYTKDNWENYEKVMDITKLHVGYGLNFGCIDIDKNNILIFEKNGMELKNIININLSNFTQENIDIPKEEESYGRNFMVYGSAINEKSELYLSYVYDVYSDTDTTFYFEIARTRDKGVNWEILKSSEIEADGYNPFNSFFPKINKMEFKGDRILAVNYEGINYSEDGGDTWSEFKYNFSQYYDEKDYKQNLYVNFVDGKPIVFHSKGYVEFDINSNSVIEKDLKVYPNPVKDKVRVEISESGINLQTINVELVNISSGKINKIEEFKLSYGNNNTIEIGIKDFIKGAYLLNIKSGDLKISKKIIIE